MLGSIVKNIFLPQNKSILFKRYNIPWIVCNVKQSTNSSKEQKLQGNTDGDNDDSDEPIKYSSSKAATMRVNEYRDPYGDQAPPWYQSLMIALSLTVFLTYFCILRKENDIDLILSNELGDTLSNFDKLSQKNTTKFVSK